VVSPVDGFCICGSGIASDSCCLPVIQGVKPAQTAEQLMRSRYTAYVMENSEYLMQSWYPDTRPESLSIKAGEVSWTGLSVGKLKAGQPGDKKGEVEFIASFKQAGESEQVQENSRFVFENGKWFYLDGDISKGEKVGRNDPCPCGSGRKFKKCCAGKR
jgi:SEC-C motif domain protein